MSLFAIFLLLLSIPCSSIGALISPSRSLSARHDMCPAKCECQKSYSRQKQQQNGHYEEGHGHQHSATESSTKAEEEQLEEEAEDNEDVQLISVRCVRGGLNDSEFLALLQSLPADVHELEVRGTMATRNNFQWNDNINRLSRLSRLVLSNSDIPALSQSIRLPLLRVLDLSGNNLEHIQLGSFLGMPMLERLDLSRNRISVLPTGAFIYLKKLSSLSLSHNRLNRELTTGNLLRGPRGLRELELDGNRLSARQLNEMFGDLGTLTRLEVNYCGLNDAAVWTLNLSSVPELRRIGLAGNNLSQVPSTTLRALALLDTVDLSHNLIRTLGPCAFCGSNISRVLLGHNLLGLGDDFRFIHREAFADTHILELDLSYNQLRSAGFNSVMLHGAQESLEVLHLSGNDHLTLDGQQLIGTLPHLKELHVADSELGSVPYSLPKAYGQLTLLNLSGNGLDLLPPNLGSMFPQLHVLDLSRNQFSSFPHALMSFIDRLEMVFLHNCPWDCQCAAQPLQLHMLRRLDNKDVLRYDETLCAEPVMLRGQPMHRVQKINDCAILFGANYGITQNTELLLILGALLLAALLLSVVLALLLYCGRERNQKGTYVTGEGVGEEGDGKKMTTTTTMMSKSTTLISNGMAAGGGGRGLMDLDAMAMNGNAHEGADFRHSSVTNTADSPLLISNDYDQFLQSRHNSMTATTKSSLAALAVQNLHFPSPSSTILSPSASLSMDHRLREPLLLMNHSPSANSDINNHNASSNSNTFLRTMRTQCPPQSLVVHGTTRRPVPSGLDMDMDMQQQRRNYSVSGAGGATTNGGVGAKTLITF